MNYIGDEEDKSLSELQVSLNTSSADTVLLSQNSQEEVEMEDTQIIDQSAPPSPGQIPTKAEEKSANKKFKSSGGIYWLNEFLKSRTKPKKLNIEDDFFPSTSPSPQRLNMNQSQNPEESLKDFFGGISEEGLRHPAKLTRGIKWIKLTRKNKTLFGGEDSSEPASSSNAGKRRGSSPVEETPGSSTSPPLASRKKSKATTPNSSRVKGKKEQPQGICPMCERTMKMTVLERHAGEAVCLVVDLYFTNYCLSAECQGVSVTRKCWLFISHTSLVGMMFRMSRMARTGIGEARRRPRPQVRTTL